MEEELMSPKKPIDATFQLPQIPTNPPAPPSKPEVKLFNIREVDEDVASSKPGSSLPMSVASSAMTINLKIPPLLSEEESNHGVSDSRIHTYTRNTLANLKPQFVCICMN